MARKRPSGEDILKLPSEIEVKLTAGSDVQWACRGVGNTGIVNSYPTVALPSLMGLTTPFCVKTLPTMLLVRIA